MANQLMRCWVVTCRTPDCGVLILDVIGVHDPTKMYFLKECRDFSESCNGCGKEHTYRIVKTESL